MNVRVDAAAASEQPALRNLLELYAYDFSEIVGLDVGDDGRFPDYPIDDYWKDPALHPFLIRVDDRLAGFALIQSRSRLSGASGVWDVAEFFVLRKYRRAGAGTEAARQIFAAHAGPWEVRQRSSNTPAIAFWRRAIASCGYPFEDVVVDDATWTGPVQRFTSARPGVTAPSRG